MGTAAPGKPAKPKRTTKKAAADAAAEPIDATAAPTPTDGAEAVAAAKPAKPKRTTKKAAAAGAAESTDGVGEEPASDTTPLEPAAEAAQEVTS